MAHKLVLNGFNDHIEILIIDSRIDVGQRINIGLGKVGKKINHHVATTIKFKNRALINVGLLQENLGVEKIQKMLNLVE